MKLTFLALAALAPASVTLLASGSEPLSGPGAVLEMHEKLFAALDRGDLETVRAHLGETPMGAEWSAAGGWTHPPGFLAWGSEGNGKGFAAESREDGLRSLLAWGSEGTKGGGGWSTKITRAWSDCHSPELSFAALEFERTRTVEGKSETVRYRSTSLVSYEDGRWVLWLFHASRV